MSLWLDHWHLPASIVKLFLCAVVVAVGRRLGLLISRFLYWHFVLCELKRAAMIAYLRLGLLNKSSLPPLVWDQLLLHTCLDVIDVWWPLAPLVGVSLRNQIFIAQTLNMFRAAISQRAEDVVVFQLLGVILKWTKIEFSTLKLCLSLRIVKVNTFHSSLRINPKIH